jgi:LPXTG-motif cell wall-anchored protein
VKAYVRARRGYKLPRAGNSSGMDLITILLIVVIVLLLFGGLGYRRRL